MLLVDQPSTVSSAVLPCLLPAFLTVSAVTLKVGFPTHVG